MQKKIRDKEMQKIPYILVVGNREREEGTVSVRKSGKENLGSMKTEDFIGMMKKEA